MGPAEVAGFEGWFPRGEVSLVSGTSGSGKTTLIRPLLAAQEAKQKFLGHETYGLNHLSIMIDRGKNAHIRTERRMNIHTDEQNISFARAGVLDDAALIEINNKIEEKFAEGKPPAVVFVEGLDMLVEDSSSPACIISFMTGLSKIAEHYHVALIGSVGAPKVRVGEGYMAKRDTVFGSAYWSRLAETIIAVQYLKGDDTDKHRVMFVLPRNAPPEKFNLVMQGGILVIDDTPEQDNEKKQKYADRLLWYQTQTDWFVASDVQHGLGVSSKQAYRYLAEDHAKGILKTKQKVRGEARVYRWKDTQPSKPEKTEAKTEGETVNF